MIAVNVYFPTFIIVAQILLFLSIHAKLEAQSYVLKIVLDIFSFKCKDLTDKDKYYNRNLINYKPVDQQ